MRPRPAFLRLFPTRRADVAGVAAVEFALIAPVLLTLLAGAFDLGRALDQSIRMESAALAGAQLAIVQRGATQGEVRCAVERSLGATCTVTRDSQGNVTGITSSGLPSWASNLTVSFTPDRPLTDDDVVCFCSTLAGQVGTTAVTCDTACANNAPIVRTRRVTLTQNYAPILPFTRFLTARVAQREVVATF